MTRRLVAIMVAFVLVMGVAGTALAGWTWYDYSNPGNCYPRWTTSRAYATGTYHGHEYWDPHPTMYTKYNQNGSGTWWVSLRQPGPKNATLNFYHLDYGGETGSTSGTYAYCSV